MTIYGHTQSSATIFPSKSVCREVHLNNVAVGMAYHIPATNVYIVMVLAQGCRDRNAFGFELYVMYMYTFGFIILLYIVV